MTTLQSPLETAGSVISPMEARQHVAGSHNHFPEAPQRRTRKVRDPFPPIPAFALDAHPAGALWEVRVGCPYCGGVHVHKWTGPDEPVGLRVPQCAQLGDSRDYWVRVDERCTMPEGVR